MRSSSLLVVDPERFPDDADESMARVGQCPVYTHTTLGEPLRGPDPELRARLMRDYYSDAMDAVGALEYEDWKRPQSGGEAGADESAS